MATRELGLGRARRRRWLTGLLVGGISLTALAVALTYRGIGNRQASSLRNTPSPAPDVNQQLSGYTFTRSDQGRPVFTIHAARTVSYQQNKATVLEDVTVEIFGHTGDRGDILRTHRCEYHPLTGDFSAAGPVQIELSAHSSSIPGSGVQGNRRIVLETSGVAYHQNSEVAETDQPVKFHTGPVSGTAMGMTYAVRDGWLVLKHNVAVDLLRGTVKAPRPPVHLTASSLRYDKQGRLAAVGGPVEVTSGKRRAAAESAEIALDDHNHVTWVNLQGHVKAFDAGLLRSTELSAGRVRGDFDPASGQLRHITAEEDVVGESRGKGSASRLTAQRLDMDLQGKHPRPLGGAAKGNVQLVLESQSAPDQPGRTPGNTGLEKKTLSAAEVRFEFRADGHSLKDAETAGPGTLRLTPADPRKGEKVISAGQLLMTFDARSRMESLRGLAPTQVLFRPPANAPAGTATQQSQADRLDAFFDAGTQALREARQAGNFQYRDGDRQASAEEARYYAQAQTLLLLGHPQVWDPDSRARAVKMTIDMRTGTAIGEGKVQATHLPVPAPGAAVAKAPPLPINVLADRMVAQRQSQTIHYEGHVRAWRGADVLESSALDVSRAQKRVSSGSQVVTTFLEPAAARGGQPAGPHASREMRPVTVRADNLEYLDAGRRARYHGNVRLTTEGATFQSDRLDVYFTPRDTGGDAEVDRAEADGHVRVTQPGRVGSGNHAEYFAGPGKVVLTGGPPMLVDEEKGSTTGQRLTFFIRDDRLFVDGGDQSPSLSKHRVAP